MHRIDKAARRRFLAEHGWQRLGSNAWIRPGKPGHWYTDAAAALAETGRLDPNSIPLKGEAQ